MVNDLVNSKPAQAVPCFDLSNNDSYLMSSSGGKVSLFNMMTFKVTKRFKISLLLIFFAMEIGKM